MWHGPGTAVLLAVLLGMPAIASGAPSGEPSAEQQAAALYAEGSTHFNLAEYDQAIDAFKQAYALSAAPGFLYNIAQAYRLKGDCAQAVLFYGNYLRAKPDADNRAAVEERIHEMQRCQGPSASPAASGSHTAAPRPAASPGATGTFPRGTGADAAARGGNEPDEPAGEPPNASLWAGVVLGTAGLAAVGTGIYFGVASSAAADEVTNLSEMRGEWDAHFQDTEARGKLFEKLAIACWTIGGTAALLGGWLTYRGLAAENVTVALDGSPDGARLRFRWIF